MSQKTEVIKGYTLTYLGTIVALIFSAFVSWFIAMQFLTEHMFTLGSGNFDNDIRLGVDNLFTALFAAGVFMIVFQICLLIAAPICVRIALIKLPLHRKSTIIWIDTALFIGLFIYLAALALYKNSFFLVIAIWLLAAPFLARLLATRQKKVVS